MYNIKDDADSHRRSSLSKSRREGGDIPGSLYEIFVGDSSLALKLRLQGRGAE